MSDIYSEPGRFRHLPNRGFALDLSHRGIEVELTIHDNHDQRSEAIPALSAAEIESQIRAFVGETNIETGEWTETRQPGRSPGFRLKISGTSKTAFDNVFAKIQRLIAP